MLALTVRLICSLAVVIGLLLLITKLSAHRLRGPSDALMQLVERKSLSRGSSISVVSVGKRVLVIGTTEHEVRLLTELDAADLEHDTIETDEPELELETPPARLPRPRPKLVPPLSESAVAGSVLSTQTWKQAFAAATGRVRQDA